MSHSVKVAISLPQELFAAAERARREGGVSRSELFRRALESFLRRRREERAVERYVRGYLEHPESDQEVAAIHAVSADALATERWD